MYKLMGSKRPLLFAQPVGSDSVQLVCDNVTTKCSHARALTELTDTPLAVGARQATACNFASQVPQSLV
jgi:hypothetical protein